MGFADLAEKLINNYEQRQQGRRDQRAADLEAENAELKRMAAIASQAPLTREELEDKLGKGEF